MGRIADSLYRLLMKNGKFITFYRKNTSSANYSTGVKIVDRDYWNIKKVLILPGPSKRDFVYDLSYIAANKNFTYGGFFTAGQKVIVVRRIDMPFKPSQEDWFVYQNVRLNVQIVTEYDEMECFVIDVKALPAEKSYGVIDIKIEHTLQLSDGATPE